MQEGSVHTCFELIIDNLTIFNNDFFMCISCFFSPEHGLNSHTSINLLKESEIVTKKDYSPQPVQNAEV